MQKPYNTEKWAAATTRGRQLFNYHYRMLGNEIKGYKLLKVVSMQDNLDLTEKVYLWQSERDPLHEIIRVAITERYNWQQAQKSLHDHLTDSMRPDIAEGTRNLAQLGDVVFVGREPHSQTPGAISFSTGNLFVSVTSNGEKIVDVSDIATRLDRTLSELPAEKELERGSVRDLRPSAATVKSNEATVLIEKLSQRVAEGGWLKVIVPDGELSRKGDALHYHTGEGGEKQIGIYAISRE